MELRPAIQIQSMLKSMTDVVLPAVDPHNKLAQEQSRLVIGMLSLLAARLPLSYRYERDELARFLALADTLEAQARTLPGAVDALQGLSAVVETGRDVLARAGAEPGELEAANFALREKVGALISLAYTATDSSERKQLCAAVSAHARTQLLRERAWLITQGWEAEPGAVPAIEALLDGDADGAMKRNV